MLYLAVDTCSPNAVAASREMHDGPDGQELAWSRPIYLPDQAGITEPPYDQRADEIPEVVRPTQIGRWLRPVSSKGIPTISIDHVGGRCHRLDGQGLRKWTLHRESF